MVCRSLKIHYTKKVLPFFSYWYITSATRFLHSLQSAWQATEAQIGIIDTFHNLDKPLFQDYSRQGRIIGFVFRLGRIIAGLLTMAGTAAFYAALYVFWLIFPPLCLVSIAGSFFGV